MLSDDLRGMLSRNQRVEQCMRTEYRKPPCHRERFSTGVAVYQAAGGGQGFGIVTNVRDSFRSTTHNIQFERMHCHIDYYVCERLCKMTEMTSAWARKVSVTLGPLGRSPQAAHVIVTIVTCYNLQAFCSDLATRSRRRLGGS